MKIAKNNDTVKVHYCGKLKTGEIFDNSYGREPLQFTIGASQVVPGFENNIIGMSINEKKEFIIPCEDAYGQYTEELILSLPKKNLPDIEYKVNQHMQLQLTPELNVDVIIKEIKDNEIVFDANHRLAGLDLIFEVELLEIINKESDNINK